MTSIVADDQRNQKKNGCCSRSRRRGKGHGKDGNGREAVCVKGREGKGRGWMDGWMGRTGTQTQPHLSSSFPCHLLDIHTHPSSYILSIVVLLSLLCPSS